MPFKPGVSGNPGGRPRFEPRIRRHARRYDRRVVAELWRIGSDPKVDADVRRKALMDLQAIGSGRPPTTQEVGGKDGAPLVSVHLGSIQPGQQLSPEQTYRAMIEGVIAPDATAFRPAIESEPAGESQT